MNLMNESGECLLLKAAVAVKLISYIHHFPGSLFSQLSGGFDFKAAAQ